MSRYINLLRPNLPASLFVPFMAAVGVVQNSSLIATGPSNLDLFLVGGIPDLWTSSGYLDTAALGRTLRITTSGTRAESVRSAARADLVTSGAARDSVLPGRGGKA